MAQMKRRFTVLVYPRADDVKRADMLVESVGRGYLVEGSPAYYRFSFRDEQGVATLCDAARELGFSDQQISTRSELVYTRSERLASPLLWLTVTEEPRGHGGPGYGTQYDLSQACGRCGSGARQISPLILNSAQVRGRGDIFQTLDGETLVSEELGARLSAPSLTGGRLWRAVAHDEGAVLPWYQILAETEMPPMSKLTRGILRDRPCPECSRDGYFHQATQPVEIVYDRDSIEMNALPDIVHTYERFGNSVIKEPFRDSHFGQPLILVKPRVFEVFEKHKVRRVEFVPVKIV